MEVTEEEVTFVLTEAFAGYLKIIELEQKLHESSQPRQGKSIETQTDVARILSFQSRTLVTETCLRFAPRIAPIVRKWAGGSEEEENGAQMEELIDLGRPLIKCYVPSLEEDDEPFVNPMTGQWIQPITSRSAGPSNWYRSSTRNEPVHSKQEGELGGTGSGFSNLVRISQADTYALPPSIKGKERQGSRTTAYDEDLIDFSTPDLSKQLNPVQGPSLWDLFAEDTATSYIKTARDSAQLDTNPFSDQYQFPETPGFDTPRTTTSNTNAFNSPPQPSNNSSMLFEEDLAAALKLKSEWVDSIHQSIYSFDTPPADTTSSPQFDLDCLIAQRLQTEFDNELQQQETYAHQIYQTDQQLAADLEHDLAEARSLASQWEAQDEYTQQDIKHWQEKWQHEDQQVAAQADFAKEVLRAEQEREESIRRDMAAATAVQMQWEAEALELERQVRRAAEEAERREEEERRRLAAEMAERERRAQIERARIAREEAERRAKEERRRKMAECVSCMEEGERKEMCVLSCGHGYCGGCVTGLSSSISLPPFPSMSKTS